MRKATVVSALLVILWALPSPNRALSQRPFLEISRQCALSVVAIVGLNENLEPMSSGTGFVLDAHGHVVTNRHVLAGAFTAVAKTIDQKTGEVLEVVQGDPNLDLLVVRTSLKNTTPVALGDSDRVYPGQSVFGLANIRDFQATLFKGSVLAIRGAGDMALMQMTVPILPGCSGEPLFDLSGHVIAVATAFADLDQNLNFALPVNDLNRLKPVRRKLSDLSPSASRFEAALQDKTVVEILVTRHEASAPLETQEPMPQEEPLRFLRTRTPSKKPAARPGLVYFKNGKTLLCDRAWRRDETVFLVIHGKSFAVGYPESQIEMNRSFRL
jgi:hypothetical protein